MKIQNIELEWLGHAGFRIKAEGKVIYIDPYQLDKAEEKADLLLISHSHYDHCSQADIEKVTRDGSLVACTPDCQSSIARLKALVKVQLVAPGKAFSFNGLKIKAVKAYNPTKRFHPSEEGWVGYVIEAGKTAIYHAGDTDLIPEMKALADYTKKDLYLIALLPVGGTYTMTAQEAAKAAALIKPSLAIPMHYGTIIGSRADAEQFVRLCKEQGIKAQLLEKS